MAPSNGIEAVDLPLNRRTLYRLSYDGVVGDFVMVHVGYAIQKIAEADARTTWELLDQILEESGA